jgi:cytochrome c biogenesis protein CcmG/thiol:disulfide interchange protein DsbE
VRAHLLAGVAALVVCALIVVAVGAALSRSSDARSASGPPAVTLPSLREGRLAPVAELAALRYRGGPPLARVRVPPIGGRPAILAFFASWCTSCRADLAVLAKVAPRYTDKVTLVGIDVNDSAGQAARLLAKIGDRFAVGSDPNASFAERLGLDGLPDLVIVASNGHLLGKVYGPITARQLRRLFGELVARG